MKEVGLGREGMSKFCDVFNMPPPSNAKSWALHNRSITKVGETVLREHLVQAGRRVRQFWCNEDPSLDADSTIDVAVTIDGTWAKRGFTSNFGVVPAMSVDTGEIIDIAVMSKYCDECANWSWLPKDDFEKWQRQHVDVGECDRNHFESSPAMEMRAAEIIWGRSLELHNLRYRYYVSDGDSKGFSAVSSNKPYGDIAIEKLDCVNHVGKRMGTALRKLVKSDKNVSGGAKGLSERRIKKMTDYYRNAIMKNTTISKDVTVRQVAVAQMQKDIRAVLHHSVQHEDPEEQHKFCPDDSWCVWRTNPTTYKDTDHLPAHYLRHMTPLFDRLSKAELLQGCLPGLTQNQNEAFNHILWQRRPKDRFFGSKAVVAATTSAVLNWNVGASSREEMMNAMMIPGGRHTMSGSDKKDMRRITSAMKDNAEVIKRKRKASRLEKLTTESVKKVREGKTYGAGEFDAT